MPPSAALAPLLDALLDEDGVLVAPGCVFDLARDDHLVVSHLPGRARFRAGVERIAVRLASLR